MKQVNNIIQNIDSGKLTLDNFKENDIIDSLEDSDLIGQGAVGKVYLIDDKYVVKEVLPCNADPKSALYIYCSDLINLNNKIPTTPGGFGKKRYTLPNLLSEISIGMILGRMKESVSFAATTNSNVSEDLNVYIVMDAHKKVVDNMILDPLLKMNLENPKTFIYMLFQISHALLTAQQKHKLTHYDLHIENILWNDWPFEKKYLSYPLPNTEERLVIPKDYCPFILKISDFALSRLETRNSLVTPLVDNFPERTYGEFHPSYDIVSFIGTILIDNKYREAFDSLFDNLDIYKFMIIFTLWVFNDKDIKQKGSTREDLDKVRDIIGNKYYTSIGTIPNKFNFRPKKELDFILYSNTKSMVTIVNFLAKILQGKKYALLSDSKNENVIYLERLVNKYKEYDLVSTYTPEIKINKLPEMRQTSGNYEEMIIDDVMKVRSYHVLTNLPPKTFNFTVEDKQLDTCPIQEHYMTALFVNKDYIKDHTIKLDCCKLDPANYLLRTNKPGFIINGGFFAVKEDFLPVGKYKDLNNSINKYPIPEKYKDVFRYIILKDNKLTIEKKYNNKDQVFSSGPVLIEKGKIVFNPNEERFNCTDLNHSEKDTLELTEDSITVSGHYKYKSIKENGFSCTKEFVPDVKTYPRCDKIEPGELSHSDNPNPRSAFCILSDGNYMFVTVEGRSNRGIGFDLYTMAKSILTSFPKVVSMVNLDGGRSIYHWSGIIFFYNLKPDLIL